MVRQETPEKPASSIAALNSLASGNRATESVR